MPETYSIFLENDLPYFPKQFLKIDLAQMKKPDTSLFIDFENPYRLDCSSNFGKVYEKNKIKIRRSQVTETMDLKLSPGNSTMKVVIVDERQVSINLSENIFQHSDGIIKIPIQKHGFGKCVCELEIAQTGSRMSLNGNNDIIKHFDGIVNFESETLYHDFKEIVVFLSDAKLAPSEKITKFNIHLKSSSKFKILNPCHSIFIEHDWQCNTIATTIEELEVKRSEGSFKVSVSCTTSVTKDTMIEYTFDNHLFGSIFAIGEKACVIDTPIEIVEKNKPFDLYIFKLIRSNSKSLQVDEQHSTVQVKVINDVKTLTILMSHVFETKLVNDYVEIPLKIENLTPDISLQFSYKTSLSDQLHHGSTIKVIVDKHIVDRTILNFDVQILNVTNSKGFPIKLPNDFCQVCVRVISCQTVYVSKVKQSMKWFKIGFEQSPTCSDNERVMVSVLSRSDLVSSTSYTTCVSDQVTIPISERFHEQNEILDTKKVLIKVVPLSDYLRIVDNNFTVSVIPDKVYRTIGFENDVLQVDRSSEKLNISFAIVPNDGFSCPGKLRLSNGAEILLSELVYVMVFEQAPFEKDFDVVNLEIDHLVVPNSLGNDLKIDQRRNRISVKIRNDILPPIITPILPQSCHQSEKFIMLKMVRTGWLKSQVFIKINYSLKENITEPDNYIESGRLIRSANDADTGETTVLEIVLHDSVEKHDMTQVL